MDDRKDICPSFSTFNHCKFGYEGCRLWKSHRKLCYRQEFFIAAILYGSSPVTVRTENHGSRRIEEFFVIPMDRHDLKMVKLGEIVLFQASNRRSRENLRYGRLVANFGIIPPSEKKIRIESCQLSGFTIDPPGTRCRDDALTIEDCQEHEVCKKIGIHVIAAALQKLDKYTELPFYAKFQKTFLRARLSFDRDQITLAVSIYVHTNAQEVTGPVFTPVYVQENYTYDRKIDYQEKMRILWRHFVGKFAVDKVLNQFWSRDCLFNRADSWREQILLVVLTRAFNKAVTAYASSFTDRFFITKSVKPPPEMTTRKYTVVTTFMDLYTDAQRAVTSEKLADASTTDRGEYVADKQISPDDKILVAMVSAIRSQKNAAFSDPMFPLKYERDVETAALAKDRIFQSNSPLRKFQNFLNQQILIHCMLGYKDKVFYTEKDLLGILGIRFRTPTLYNASVIEVKSEEILLDYPTNSPISRSLHAINLGDLRGTADSMEDKVIINLKGISCPDGDYCNRALAHFEWEEFESLERKMRESREISAEVKNLFQNLDITEEDSPYKKEGENTILTLRPSAELQVQVSNSDAEDHNDLGMRLLRIGKNCHLCFTHVNHPEKAFMSDRKDIRRLINTEKIKSLKQARKDGSLKSVILKNVWISWDGEYFAGGSFEKGDSIDESVVDVGDLLCIRKEVFTREKSIYVWTSHGIVWYTDDEEVKFSVCTMSQSNNDPGRKAFYIEIIKTPSQEKPDEAIPDEGDCP